MRLRAERSDDDRVRRRAVRDARDPCRGSRSSSPTVREGSTADRRGPPGQRVRTRGVEEELRRTRDELRRARQLVNLAETLDLDEVLDAGAAERCGPRRCGRGGSRPLRGRRAPCHQGDEPLCGGSAAVAGQLAAGRPPQRDDGPLPLPRRVGHDDEHDPDRRAAAVDGPEGRHARARLASSGAARSTSRARRSLR